MKWLSKKILGFVWLMSLLGIFLTMLGLLVGSETLYYAGLLLAAPVYLVLLPVAFCCVCYCLALVCLDDMREKLLYKNPIIESLRTQEGEEDDVGQVPHA